MRSYNFSLLVKIIIVLVVLVSSCVFFVNGVSNLLNEENASYNREISMQNSAILTNTINDNIHTLEVLAKFISSYEYITCENVNKAIEATINERNFIKINVILPDGSNIYDDKEQVGYKSYFKLAIEGTPNVSEVIRSDNDNDNMLVFAIPIKKNGEVVGVLRATYPVFELCEILNIHPIGKDGYIVIVENTGNVVLYSKGIGTGLEYRNIFRYIRSFSGNEQATKKIYYDIQAGKSDSLVFNKNNESKYISYIPINEIKGWYLLTIEPYNILSKNALCVVGYFIIVFVIMILLTVVVILYISKYQHDSKRKIENLAFVDRVTGGKNINKFCIEAKNIINKNKENFCIVKLDIDKFKYYNDVYGYEIGNEILKHVYNSLTSMLHKNEIVARENGDNFVVLMKYINVSNITQRLIKLCSNPINLNEFNSELSTNYILELYFGVYNIIGVDTDIQSMIDKANIAQKKVKGNRNEKIYFYNEGLKDTIIFEKELENTMLSSLISNDFVLYLQPKYNTISNTVVGAEALVRWNHPEKGLLYPADFIYLFERNGFIVNIDMFMLENTCKIIRRWIDIGVEPVPISLNMSKINFNNENLVSQLKSVIDKYNVPVNLIEIELVETIVCDDIDRFLDIINKMKEIGICISMDDFGTGYSSLNLLKDLPIDVIKLDRGFFNESTYSNKGKTIVANIIKMANELEIKVICEGIETEEQLSFVKNVGCHIVQGFLLSKPVTVEKFEAITYSKAHIV